MYAGDDLPGGILSDIGQKMLTISMPFTIYRLVPGHNIQIMSLNRGCHKITAIREMHVG